MSVPDILQWIQAKYFVPLQDILQVPDTERKKKKRQGKFSDRFKYVQILVCL